MVCGSLEIEILNTFWNLNSENEDRDMGLKERILLLRQLWTDL